MKFLNGILVALVVVASVVAAALGLFRVSQDRPGATLQTSVTANPRTPSVVSSASATATGAQSNPSTPLVVNPATGEPIPASQLADCQSSTPVIDVGGKPSAASKSVTTVYNSNCDILVGAKPATFVALDYFYGKDTNHVWILASPWDEWMLTTQDADILGADSATFTLIPNPNPSTIHDEGFDDDYTKDKDHVYDLGAIVPGADPATFILPPGQ